MKTDKKLGKYLFFSDMRQINIRGYMQESKDYSVAEINSLYTSLVNREMDIYHILGILLSEGIKKLGTSDLIELAKNESKFRTELSKSKSKKVLEILSKFNIKDSDIKSDLVAKFDPSRFNPYRFIELAILKKDSEILEILKKKKNIVDHMNTAAKASRKI